MADGSPDETLANLGEQTTLKRLQKFCPQDVIGDDGAAIPWRSPSLCHPESPSVSDNHSDDYLVVTTDVLVDGVHFSDRTTPPHSVGWRGAAANLSDLAAMGAEPVGLTVGLALPGNTQWRWIDELYRGLKDCGDAHSAPIIGGDLCRSPVATLSITALGRSPRSHLIQRSALQPGDYLVATGVHGASRAGLELLLHPEAGANLSRALQGAWVRAHQYPQPRLDWLPMVRNANRAIAGMDSSDGLGDAVVQLAQASGCGVELWMDSLPMPEGLRDWAGSDKAREWMFYGGEDFELVLGGSAALIEQLTNQLDDGRSYFVMGRAVEGEGVKLLDRKGGRAIAKLSLSQGFQHFK
ncbi:MAG: thiamine-phosphate kinase [Cyanobacteria bacterium P01_C01_bin.89]